MTHINATDSEFDPYVATLPRIAGANLGGVIVIRISSIALAVSVLAATAALADSAKIVVVSKATSGGSASASATATVTCTGQCTVTYSGNTSTAGGITVSGWINGKYFSAACEGKNSCAGREPVK